MLRPKAGGRGQTTRQSVHGWIWFRGSPCAKLETVVCVRFCARGVMVRGGGETTSVSCDQIATRAGFGRGSVFDLDSAQKRPGPGGSGGEVSVATKRGWAALAAEHSVSLPAVALAFALLPACATKIVVGMASPREVQATVDYAAETVRVPPRLWAEAKARGLLAAAVPTPVPIDG